MKPTTLLAILTGLSLVPQEGTLAESQSEQQASGLYRLKAIVIEHGQMPLLDTPCHYLSEQGADAYSRGDLGSAEKCYRAAIEDAEKIHADPRVKCTLETNLGTVLRDRHNYKDSETFFLKALDAEKAMSKRQTLLAYTGRQYAAMLRQTGRTDEAKTIEGFTRDGFVPCNPRLVKMELNGVDSLVKTKKPIEAGSTTMMANWTLTIEPIPGGSDFAHSQTKGLNVERVNGPLDFYFDSDFRPVHVVLKVPPDTAIWGQGAKITETYTFDGKPNSVFFEHYASAPCNFEATTVSAQVPFRNVGVFSYTHFEGPRDAKNPQTASWYLGRGE